jgi:hypothetical protein
MLATRLIALGIIAELRRIETQLLGIKTQSAAGDCSLC